MDEDPYRAFARRMRVLFAVAVAVFVTLVGGLFNRQILMGDEYRELERRQNNRRIVMPGPRGNIFDREGRLLVGNRPLFSAVVYLNELRPDFRKAYIEEVRWVREAGLSADRQELQVRARARVVGEHLVRVNTLLGRGVALDHGAVERHFAQNLLLPFPLITDLSELEYARLVDQLPVDSPVQILSDSARFYPYGRAAAHVLGFVVATDEVPDSGLPGEELTTFRHKGKAGRSGLERFFDEQLQGKAGGEIWIVDPSGFLHQRTVFVQPVKGRDLYTSLDLDLQLAAEKALGNHKGAVVAIEVESGEVLALASGPGYDLNDLTPFIPYSVDADIRERGAWLNRAVQGLYPPGSTFKLLTALAAGGAQLIGPDLRIHCPGFTMVGNRRFACHSRHGHGDESFEESIRDSCNVYYYVLGQRLGVGPLAETARLFGLHEPTGIELPGETRGMVVPDPAFKRRRLFDNWYPGDTANFSIGQGFLRLTPLQMACFTASLARGETRTRPTLLRVDRPGRAGHGGQPIPVEREFLERVYRGMEMSASTGTGRLVAVRGVRIAAKTGTAQVWSEGSELTIAWIVGFAPADRPRVAFAVAIEGQDPDDNYHGGSTAAPIAKAVLEPYLRKHHLGPE